MGDPSPVALDDELISDCEVGALMAPSGSVEWLCVPRMDGPQDKACVISLRTRVAAPRC
jgi:alpha,alpha-trehalase